MEGYENTGRWNFGEGQVCSPSTVRSLLPREAGIDKCRADRFGILDRDAAGSNCFVPSAGDLFCHIRDDFLSFVVFKEKASVLRKYVCSVGKSSLIPAHHRQIAVVLTDLRGRCQIVGGRSEERRVGKECRSR